MAYTNKEQTFTVNLKAVVSENIYQKLNVSTNNDIGIMDVLTKVALEDIALSNMLGKFKVYTVRANTDKIYDLLKKEEEINASGGDPNAHHHLVIKAIGGEIFHLKFSMATGNYCIVRNDFDRENLFRVHVRVSYRHVTYVTPQPNLVPA